MPADPASDKVLFTVGAGKQSIALLSLLRNNWKNIRLGARSDTSIKQLQNAFPNAEIIKADLNDVKSIEQLIKGVNVIFHFGPSFHPREADLGIRVVDAAASENRRNPGVIKHFIFSSVLGSQLRKLPNHDCKRLVEEALMESGIAYTILQPTFRMDMFPLKAVLGQTQDGSTGPIVYKSAWNPKVKTSFVTLHDQSEAARIVLEEREKHFYAIYQLVSTPEPISYTDFVKRAVSTAGREVEVGYKGFEEASAFYMDVLFGGEDKADPEVRDGLQRTLLYYNYYGLCGSSNHLEWLIGRKGQTVEEWAREVLRLCPACPVALPRR
jgi:uncharacterized protein YbjT (DUF2867 family)